MVAGTIDLEFEELRQPGAGPFQSTECARIFAESMNVGMEGERNV